MSESKYAQLGIDVKKRGIGVFTDTIDNLFPNAFCVITPAPESKVFVTHTDGAGSKPVQTVLHWLETEDDSVISWLADDVVSMNVGDALCVGITQGISFVDYVAINPLRLDKVAFLAALDRGFAHIFSLFRQAGMPIYFAGGETADLPDQITSVDVSGTYVAQGNYSEVIDGKKIQPGDVIVSLASDGRAIWEEKVNSGIGCNGITLARKCLMSQEYNKKYPWLSHPNKPFEGQFLVTDFHHDLGMTVSEAILSPTRLFAPVMLAILEELRTYIHGIVFNTGGGQTKCLRLGRKIQYIKDNLPDPPPIFYLIQKESGEEWEAMHEDYNMGAFVDFIGDSILEKEIPRIAKEFLVDAWRTGFCKESPEEENILTIQSRFGDFEYRS